MDKITAQQLLPTKVFKELALKLFTYVSGQHPSRKAAEICFKSQIKEVEKEPKEK